MALCYSYLHYQLKLSPKTFMEREHKISNSEYLLIVWISEQDTVIVTKLS